MLKARWKLILGSGALALTIVGCTIASLPAIRLNLDGYCAERRAVLRDDEILSSLLADGWKNMQVSMNRAIGSRLAYDNLNDFERLHLAKPTFPK